MSKSSKPKAYDPTSSKRKRGVPLAHLQTKLKKIRMVLLDVDGVLTDGRIIYGDDGTEYKAFDAHDGYGIERARKAGLKIGIITGRLSPVVQRRAEELGVFDLYQNFMDKVTALEEIKRKHQLRDEECAYIGDDAFDLPLLQKVGFSAAPKDALEEVTRKVDYVTKVRGGRGAVREVIDMVLRAQEKLSPS